MVLKKSQLGEVNTSMEWAVLYMLHLIRRKHLRRLFLVTLLFLIVTGITGCSDTENPLEPTDLTENTATGIFAEAKHIESVPAAPTAPQTPIPPGTPIVTEIGYYSDWQRTKPITGNVAPGDTIHIKIVFSEGMSLVVADDETARPVLYHRIDGTLTRFKIAGFGATDADFISGDCKPVKTQAVYFGKYTVTPTNTGNFTVSVGKKSTDRQGNELAAFLHASNTPAARRSSDRNTGRNTGIGDSAERRGSRILFQSGIDAGTHPDRPYPHRRHDLHESGVLRSHAAHCRYR